MNDLRVDLQSLFKYVVQVAKNPLVTLKSVPTWSYFSLFIFLGAVSALSGVVSGLFARSFLQIFAGLFLLPLSAAGFTVLTTAIFYYTALLGFKQQKSFLNLFGLVVVCSLPALILHPFAMLLEPITLLSMAVVGIMLLVGLVDAFDFPKKITTRLLIGLYVVFVASWVIGSIEEVQESQKLELETRPETIDILEKEFSD